MATRKRNSKVSIKVADPKLANVDTKPDEKIIEEALKKTKQKVIVSNPAIIISRLNHPEYITYDGEILPVSPRAKLHIADRSKLGKLPSGILVKSLK